MKRRRLKPFLPPVIKLPKTMWTNLELSEVCHGCGYAPMIAILDDDLEYMVAAYCSGCETEWRVG